MPTRDDVPHNLEAERALLGSVLLDNEAMKIALPTLQPDDFYSQPHRVIFRAMQIIIQTNGRPCDLVTLSEELSRDGLINNAGGAAYLASLTDGVPLGASAAVSEYVRIVHEKAIQRQTLDLAWRIREEGIAGASVEEMGEHAQQLVEKAKEASAIKQPRRTRAPYPSIPEEAWYGMTKIYRTAMGDTSEASDNFHFAGFISIVGALLGKSVAVGTDEDDLIYPNLYILLVGDSGTCKDRAARRARTVLRKVDTDVLVVSHVSSIETLIDEMNDAKRNLEGRQDFTPVRAVLSLSELRDLIEKSKQKGAGNIVSRLCQAYDCPPELSARTRGQPTSIVKEPVVSVLAATNPDWMKDLDSKDLKGGLGSRVCFLPGDPKPPHRRSQRPDQTSLEVIKERLVKLSAVYPRNATKIFPITPVAEERLDKWYLKHKTLLSDDELIRFLAVRDIVHVYKLMLIHAALTFGSQIELDHVEAAITFVDFLRDARPIVFEGHGFSPTQTAQAAVERIVRDRDQISYADALRLFGRYGDSMLFKRIVDSLALPGGPVEVLFVGKNRPKRFLSWRG